MIAHPSEVDSTAVNSDPCARTSGAKAPATPLRVLALGLLGIAASTPAATGPCDIYQTGNTPCVAAHSTTRALYGSYAGNLYQVRRKSDNTTKDIGLLAPGGEANSAAQDAFCTGTTCTISLIYDQSSNHNDLTKAPGGGFPTAGLEANATAAKINLNGRTVYGVYSTGAFEPSAGVGYRNNKTKGMPVGDEAEAMYMLVSGKHYNQWCCFDYGNAETNTKDNGPGTMEAVYFGKSTQWGKGSGTGPWVMADLEDGVYAGASFTDPGQSVSYASDYVTAMLKGDTKNHWALKGGDGQKGNLATLYDGVRPVAVGSGKYNPMRKEGAIVLGIGGDNSHTAEGTFFEGCIVSGYPTNATDNAVQANIVAAGYGSSVTAVQSRDGRRLVSLQAKLTASRLDLVYTLENSGHVRMRLLDLQGRVAATLVDADRPQGRHTAGLQTSSLRAGLYTLVMETASGDIQKNPLLLTR